MQTVSKNLTAGVQLLYLAEKGVMAHNYTARYNWGVHQFMFLYNGLGNELLDAGVCSRVSKNLQLFANFKLDPTKKSDLISGFRIRFPEWNITGTIGTSGKATTMYKRQMEMFEAAFQGGIDFKDDKKPAVFGLSLTFGMQGGM